MSRILKNPLYTGRVLNGKEEVADFLTGRRQERDPAEWLVAERPKLRIVEDEVFLLAQKAAADRRARQLEEGRRQSSAHPLSAMLTCGVCGRSFRRLSRTYQNTYVRWVCAKRNADGASSCPNTTAVDEEALLRGLRATFFPLCKPFRARHSASGRSLCTFAQAEEQLRTGKRNNERQSGWRAAEKGS